MGILDNNDVDLLKALDYINPSDLTYSEWLAVGMDLKTSGYNVDEWDKWSQSDPRYKNGVCSVKWRSFGSDLTGGTIIGMAVKNGFNPYDATTTHHINRTRYNAKPKNSADEIEPFAENPTKWELAPEIETAHKRLMERNAADNVTVTKNGKETKITVWEYLTEVRKIPANFIESKKIGYAVGGHNDILKRYPEYKNADGKNNELHKIVFPYANGSGNYNYFITETIDRNAQIYAGSDAAGQPKYRNPEKYRKPKKDNETTVTLEDGTTQSKPATVPTVKAEIYNEYLLKGSDAPPFVFVVEGIYDALSVEIVGGSAIAFNGTAYKRFLSICKTFRPNTTFIIALDNDGAGNNAITRVVDGLNALNLAYIKKQAPEPYKDLNECLQNDPTLLRKYVNESMGTTANDVWYEQFMDTLKKEPKKRDAFGVLNNEYKNAQKRRNKRF